jgi:hypothetical protein
VKLNWRAGFYEMGKAGIDQSRIELKEKLQMKREKALENLRHQNSSTRLKDEYGYRAEAATVADNRKDVDATVAHRRSMELVDQKAGYDIEAAAVEAGLNETKQQRAMYQILMQDNTDAGKKYGSQIKALQQERTNAAAAGATEEELDAITSQINTAYNSWVNLPDNAKLIEALKGTFETGTPAPGVDPETPTGDMAKGEGTNSGTGAPKVKVGEDNPFQAQPGKDAPPPPPLHQATKDELNAQIEQEKAAGRDEKSTRTAKKKIAEEMAGLVAVAPTPEEEREPGAGADPRAEERDRLLGKQRGLAKITRLYDLFDASPHAFTMEDMRAVNEFIKEFNSKHNLSNPFPPLVKADPSP